MLTLSSTAAFASPIDAATADGLKTSVTNDDLGRPGEHRGGYGGEHYNNGHRGDGHRGREGGHRGEHHDGHRDGHRGY